jgi:hypothetical protein
MNQTKVIDANGHLCPLRVSEWSARRAGRLYARRLSAARRRSYMSLFCKAPHFNAAKAILDFFLDDESMNVMAKAGEFVNRKGVYPPVPDADKSLSRWTTSARSFTRKTQRVPKTISLIGRPVCVAAVEMA